MGEAIPLWRANLVRLTVFYPVLPPDYNEWFKNVAGFSAEVMEGKGPAVHSGVTDAGHLTLNVNLSRADWILQAVSKSDRPASLTDELPTLVDSFEPIQFLLKPWIASLSGIQRVALGADLLHFADIQQIAEVAARYLPGIDVGEFPHDFAYRINRPKKSQFVYGLQYFRLFKWSVARLGVPKRDVTMVLGEPLPLETEFVESRDAFRLEMDFSTIPSAADAVLRADKSAILTELINEMVAGSASGGSNA